MCNIIDYTMPPSSQPTDEPTGTPTFRPTDSPVEYNDPINTSFCGKSYLDAEANCSLETNCPSGQHKECGSGSSCWM
jgi:hypothetical protein